MISITPERTTAYYDQKRQVFCMKLSDTLDPNIIKVFELTSRPILDEDGLTLSVINMGRRKARYRTYVAMLDDLKLCRPKSWRLLYKHDITVTRIAAQLKVAQQTGNSKEELKMSKWLTDIGRRKANGRITICGQYNVDY